MFKTGWSRALAVAAVLLATTVVPARDLSFEDRIRAQEAIERVYYTHVIGIAKPFEQAVPRAVVEGKVRKYLKQGVALESFWDTPMTDEMLRQEMERQARGTRMPERLRELHRALGDDPWLVQECLARPTLADRLARSFFVSDPAIHSQQRQAAEAIRSALACGAIDPYAERSDRIVVTYVRAGVEAAESEEDPFVPDAMFFGEPASGEIRSALEDEDFERMQARFSGQVGTIGPLIEEREEFVTRVVLRETADEIAVASFAVPKRSWDEWWSSVEGSLEIGSVPAIAGSDCTLPVIVGTAQNREDAGYGLRAEHDGLPGWEMEKPCEPVNEWEETSLGGLPEPRAGHTAVWTGNEMIVWGGAWRSNKPSLSTGGRYDPAIDTWRPTSMLDAPAARIGHVAVWTGREMIVWGGGSSLGFAEFATGGRYDPADDSWTSTATLAAPQLLQGAKSVWTGRLMIVWGAMPSDGGYGSAGGRYDPETDTWTPVSSAGAPSVRDYHTPVWTGRVMLVWGGYERSNGQVVADGGRYDPETNAWSPIATDGAPAARMKHTAVWTGSKMMVWGGRVSHSPEPALDTGALYDPLMDRWMQTATENAPLGRYGHTAVWTGSRVVIWGGGYQVSGGRYDPKRDAWESTSAVGAPEARFDHTAVWTGSRMIVWGGNGRGVFLNTGGRYDPKRDSWTPTSPGAIPLGLKSQRAVWTGTEMIVWGGLLGSYVTGGRYDPTLDTWTATSVVGAPPGRQDHAAVWTGEVMVIWGGSGPQPNNTYGGRYCPWTDSWSPMSTTNAPSPRTFPTAVWTGTEVVIWGGHYNNNTTNTGGRYDPVADVWRPTSLLNAPRARAYHTAVWTGTRMVVWGGHSLAFGGYLLSGGRYDPLEDVWLPTSTFHAPEARLRHTAVWTGQEMIVWGGVCYYGDVQTGGRYDPVADDWSAVSTTGSPGKRADHTAVWTGNEMIVWGGRYPSSGKSQYLDTGGRYDPSVDAWSVTSVVNAPEPRADHSALWTGDSMLVWGGGDSSLYTIGFNDGGSYRVCAPTTGEWGK